MPPVQHFTRRPWLVVPVVLPLSVAPAAWAQDDVAGDKAALVALYDATDGASWTTGTNWTSDAALSSWHGVTTDGDGRVTALALDDNGLDGTLPAALGDLSELERLDLRDNALSGALSSALADLTSLVSLQLERSYALTGPLPAGLGELADLATVRIADTELCAPDDDAFQTWWGALSSASGLICPPAGQSVIDVAIFYTPAARRSWGTKERIEEQIQLWVAGTNTAYRTGGVNQRVALVALAETAYGEVSMYDDRNRLRATDDGHMDEVHAIRDNVAADIVLLVRHSWTDPAGGLAFLMFDLTGSRDDRAFAVVNQRGGVITLAHELGHLMGRWHERYQADSDPRAVFPYAFGYDNPRGLLSPPEATDDDRWHTTTP